MGHAAAAAPPTGPRLRRRRRAIPRPSPSGARAGLRARRIASRARPTRSRSPAGAPTSAARSTRRSALDRALALRPGDPVTLFRRATVHRARAEADRALMLRAASSPRGRSLRRCSSRARTSSARALLESSHDRAAAHRVVPHASRVFGAEARTRQLAARAATRLQAQTSPDRATLTLARHTRRTRHIAALRARRSARACSARELDLTTHTQK